MAKSELVEEIRKEYLENNQCSELHVVDHFCAYLTEWLAKHGIQGVGMQASGLALRLADGRQLGLITTDDAQLTTADTPAVGINAVHREDPRRILGDSPSVGITGR